MDDPFSTKPVLEVSRETIRDSSDELLAGCEATEMDTIPAELIDLF
jgi:hypothetical protein